MIHLTEDQFAALRADQRALALRANPPEVMNVEECALFTSLGKETLYHRVQSGTIPFKKEGGRLLFRLESIRAWLKKGEERP